MGPERNDQQKPGVQSIDRIRSFVAQSVISYTKDPLTHLVYIAVTCQCIALFLNYSLPALWYVTLVGLIGAKLGIFFYRKKYPAPPPEIK